MSGFVVSERLRRLNAMLVKYSPTQPRVPAGHSDGGRWTSGGGGGGIVAERPRGTPGTVFVPQQENVPGYVIEEFPRPSGGGITIFDGTPSPSRGNGGFGTPPFVPGQAPAASARINPQAALDAAVGNVIGRVVGIVGDAVGSVVGGIQDAFSGFEQFDVPDGTRQVPEQVNVFIGGALDEDGFQPVRNSNALKKGVAGYNIYATHDDGDRISAAIRKLPPNVQVNVIGHSWGGDTAARVALGNPGRISVLVTVDPVTRLENGAFFGGPDFNSVRNSVGGWVNVRATGKPGEGDASNLIAMVGGRWGNDPSGFAMIHGSAPYNHGDFSGMMGYDIAGGRTIQKILNRGG